jgi:hypothetical protein
MWQYDHDFVDWLDSESLGTDENPLDDDLLDLMYRAWKAAILSTNKAK